MGKALYRTYRSKKLAEIVGQEHITTALENALKKGAISHAYLFTGPRGTGKTSIARILAHEINGLPYADDATHLDIIEIDAASNRRIDEIRDLRDKVNVAPSSAKYKVYIIDEVHMLTREAFNALLKTLEEPPAHVVFILATTEIHKLPETIVSRTQRFTFKPVDLEKVAAHLKSIAKSEKIAVDDEALKLIAAHGEGSFRDSISLLDQARTIGHKVGGADIQNMLGIAPLELIEALRSGLASHDAAAVVQTLQQLQIQGSEPAQIARQLGESLRQDLLQGQATLAHQQLFALLAKLIEVPAAADPRVFLEIIMLDAALAEAPVQPLAQPLATRPTLMASKPLPAKTMAETAPSTAAVHVETPTHPNKKAEEKPAEAKKPEPTPTAIKPAKPIVAPEKPVATEVNTPVSTGDGALLDIAVWPGILHKIKQKYNTLYGMLHTAEPSFEPGKVTLEFAYAFNMKRCNDARNKKIIADTIQDVTGELVEIECIKGEGKPQKNPDEEVHAMSVASDADSPSAPPADASKEDPDYYVAQAEAEAAARPMQAVSNIFGGGELLES